MVYLSVQSITQKHFEHAGHSFTLPDTQKAFAIHGRCDPVASSSGDIMCMPCRTRQELLPLVVEQKALFTTEVLKCKTVRVYQCKA